MEEAVAVALSRRTTTQQLPTRLLARRGSYDAILNAINTGQTTIGIASLSDTNQNELMWTHYVSNSTGICIEFRPRGFIASLPDDASVVRMSYDDKPIHLDSKSPNRSMWPSRRCSRRRNSIGRMSGNGEYWGG